MSDKPEDHPKAQGGDGKLLLSKEDILRMLSDRPVDADILQALFEIRDKKSKSYLPSWKFVRALTVLEQIKNLLNEDDPVMGAITNDWIDALLSFGMSKGGFLLTNARDVLMKQQVQGMFMAPQMQPEKKGFLDRFRGGNKEQ